VSERPPTKVAFARPSIGEEEIAEVADALRSGWIAAGPRTAKFEERFAHLVEAPFAIATSSCTGALHIGYTVMDAKGGDVIMPAMTFAATALAAVHAGARPILVDIHDDTMNIDVSAAMRAIGPETRVLVGMHYAGLPCDMGALLELAEKHDLYLLEDDAHAISTSWQGRPCGSIGDTGAFSFYANKNFTTVEGGMFTTKNERFAARARALRLQGMSRDAWKRDEGASWRYEVVDAGFKYPMNDVQAAIGLVQLGKLAGWQERRAHVAAVYREELSATPGLRLPAEAPRGDVHGHHLFVVRIDPARRVGEFGHGRDGLFLALRAAGIEASVHFVPLHLHPYFQREWGYREGQFPVAERAFSEILSLPMHQGMSDDDARLVASVVKTALAG
jgi:dTDP-4-amino-4,6-dideoxygalactose transaminase